MADAHDYTAKIRGKGCDNTGITEAIAQEMYGTLGRRTLAIVEVKHARQINDDETGRTVELTITMIEPSTTRELDDHLREIARVLHQNRALKADDQQLEIATSDDLEPTVEQVIAAGQQHVAETDSPFPDDELPDDPEAEQDSRRADDGIDDDDDHHPAHGDPFTVVR